MNDEAKCASPGSARLSFTCDGKGFVFFMRLAEFGHQCQGANGQGMMVELGLFGSYCGGRKRIVDGK